MDDEWPAGLIGMLRAAAANEERRLVTEWEEGWGLLEAEALQVRGRLAAAVPLDSARPPAIRLLAVPSWGAALDGFVFLQGHRREVYVRVQTSWLPRELTLATDVRGHPVSWPGEHLPDARVFALALLDGGGPAGSLWYFPGADTEVLFGPETGGVALGGRRPDGRPFSLARVARPMPRTLQWAETEPAGVVLALIQAYTRGDARRFREALARVVADETGAGARARAARSWHRRLSRLEALWVRALLAELHALRLSDRYGCAAARGHPQLDFDEEEARG